MKCESEMCEVEVETSLKNLILYLKSNQLNCTNFEAVCQQVDDIATAELIKDEIFGNFVAGW